MVNVVSLGCQKASRELCASASPPSSIISTTLACASPPNPSRNPTTADCRPVAFEPRTWFHHTIRFVRCDTCRSVRIDATDGKKAWSITYVKPAIVP